MAIPVRIELVVTVNTDEQAELILQSVRSGLAETAIKDRVLYGGSVSFAGAETAFAPPEKKKEPEVKLSRVETKKGKLTGETAGPEERRERSHGVIGRKRFNRTGG